MLSKKIQTLTQMVGCVTIALLAIYGLLVILTGSSPVRAAMGQAATLASGEIPSTFNYQGFLREPDGSLTSGSYTITARIYDDPTEGTPHILYTTTVPNVAVQDGLFNIVLGDDPAMSAEAFADVPRYIGISLNDDPELIPRQRVHAVPWALTAKTLVSNAVVDGITSTNDVRVDGTLDVWGNENVVGDLWASYLGSTGGAWVSGTLVVTGSENVVGPLWASYLGSTGDIIVTALHQRGDGTMGAITETVSYPVSLRRYVVSSTTGIPPNDNSVPLDHTIVTAFCADKDGCTFYLAVRDWDDNKWGLKTWGPWRLSTSLGGRFSLSRWDTGGSEGNDGDGIATDLLHLTYGGSSCWLKDHKVINGASQPDAEKDFWLLNSSTYEETVCVLIMED